MTVNFNTSEDHHLSPTVLATRKVEREIVADAVNTLLKQGYSLSVNDGEETVVDRSKDAGEITHAMFTTDNDTLAAHGEDGQRVGGVEFIYGNGGGGYEVISDYSVALETEMQAVMDRSEARLDAAMAEAAEHGFDVADRALYVDIAERIDLAGWNSGIRDQIVGGNVVKIEGGSLCEAGAAVVDFRLDDDTFAGSYSIEAIDYFMNERRSSEQANDKRILDERFEANYLPDTGAEPELTSAERREAEARERRIEDAMDARDDARELGISVAGYGKDLGTDLVSDLRTKGGEIEHDGATYSLSGNTLLVDKDGMTTGHDAFDVQEGIEHKRYEESQQVKEIQAKPSSLQARALKREARSASIAERQPNASEEHSQSFGI